MEKRRASKKFKNILILGLGGVGYYLAKMLSAEGHAITAIEQEASRIKAADSELDIRLIRGDAMRFESWREADAEEIDYLIAVTDSDAVNILAAEIAHRYGIRRKIVRVRSLELWQNNAVLKPKDLHIDLVIRPEELTAREIKRLLKMRAGNVVIDIAEGEIQVVATRIGEDNPLAHTQIKDISKKFDDYFFRIVAIAREINTIIPGGDHTIMPNDHLFILTLSRNLPRLMKMFGIVEKKQHRVMIVGGSKVGLRVAQLLQDRFPVKLLELNEGRAEQLSDLLSKTEILHGDGSDADTLTEAGLFNTDTLITATSDNETNIMTSVLAKHLIRNHEEGKDCKTIALVQREKYLALAALMGSDIVLNKKVLASNEILRYIRRGQMRAVAHLHGSDAEVVELVADKGAPITKKPLYQLEGLKGKILIGGVQHDGTWEIAVGSTQVQPGDAVIAVCGSEDLRALQRLILV